MKECALAARAAAIVLVHNHPSGDPQPSAHDIALTRQLRDAGKLSLDDPVSKWLPWLPDAKRVTLRMLASSTSGYADYVTNPKFEKALHADPFRLWRPAEIIRLGVSQPSLFQPGTSWAFSDTNFMILGDVLTKAGREPLGTQIRKQILDRLGMDQTTMAYTPAVPAPSPRSWLHLMAPV